MGALAFGNKGGRVDHRCWTKHDVNHRGGWVSELTSDSPCGSSDGHIIRPGQSLFILFTDSVLFAFLRAKKSSDKDTYLVPTLSSFLVLLNISSLVWTLWVRREAECLRSTCRPVSPLTTAAVSSWHLVLTLLPLSLALWELYFATRAVLWYSVCVGCCH